MADVALELLGTRGCHLCEQAEAMLTTAIGKEGSRWRYVDIAERDDLLAAYAERIPVLRTYSAELGWPFGPLDILRLTRGATD